MSGDHRHHLLGSRLCHMKCPLLLFGMALGLTVLYTYHVNSGCQCPSLRGQPVGLTTSDRTILMTKTTTVQKPTTRSPNIRNTTLSPQTSPGKVVKEAQGPKVVILTLLHNSEPHLDTFKTLIQSLTYPHSLISIVFGEGGSKDGTARKAKEVLETLKSEFRRVDFFQFDSSLQGQGNHEWDLPIGPDPKHRLSVQKARRAHLARARNMLLASGLRDEDWVLWIDSDIIRTPPDILQQMFWTKKGIIVPRCVYKPTEGTELLYDRNTWKHTQVSRNYKAEDPGELFLEGYFHNRPPKLDMNKIKDLGDLVEVDSVGGCVLLIKAIYHKQGLVFPPYVYQHYIETEGLSQIAHSMGLKLWAMPKLKVYHFH